MLFKVKYLGLADEGVDAGGLGVEGSRIVANILLPCVQECVMHVRDRERKACYIMRAGMKNGMGLWAIDQRWVSPRGVEAPTCLPPVIRMSVFRSTTTLTCTHACKHAHE